MDRHSSLLSNSIFNVLKTFSSLIFPIITFAYASRTLGDVGIGKVNFARSMVSYFTMIAILGMKYYGTREAARLRDDKDKFSCFTHEMLLINFCTTIAAYLLLIIAIFSVKRMQAYTALLLIYSVDIVLQGLGMEWVYQAMEDYRYIAVRSVVFQIFALVAMFIFVRNANDVIPYAIVHLTATSGSNVLNFVNAKKYVRFRRYDHYEVRKHLKPLLWLFAIAVSVELYTVLDSTMLGFLKGDAAVGRYTAAVKINKMANTMITAVGVVLIPRLSYCISHKENERVRELVNKVFNYMFMLTVPAFLGLFLLNNEIITLFSGSGFKAAGITMRLLTPIVLVIPFSVVSNMQIFVPMMEDKLFLQSTAVGAVTNFFLNLLLIPRFAENGAAIATVIAETMVTVVCFINIGRFFNRRKIFAQYYQYWIAAAPIPLIAILTSFLFVHYMIRTIIVVIISIISYFGLLYFIKNQYFIEVADTFKRIYRKN